MSCARKWPKTHLRNLGHAGFSLVEALIVLIVTSMLMSVFVQVYLTSYRSHDRLQAYFQDNRSAFYARQQLRSWLSQITVPDAFRPQDYEFSDRDFISFAERDDDRPPFVGDAKQMTGFLRDPLLDRGEVRAFRLSVTDMNGMVSARMLGQLTLELGNDRIEIGEERLNIGLSLNRYPVRAIRYIDLEGRVHDAWPVHESAAALRARQRSSAPTTLEEALADDRPPSWVDTLPGAILIEFGPEAAPQILIIDVTP